MLWCYKTKALWKQIKSKFANGIKTHNAAKEQEVNINTLYFCQVTWHYTRVCSSRGYCTVDKVWNHLSSDGLHQTISYKDAHLKHSYAYVMNQCYQMNSPVFALCTVYYGIY